MTTSYRPMSRDALRTSLEDGAEIKNVEVRDVDLAGCEAVAAVIRNSLFVNVTLASSVWEEVHCTGSRFLNCRFAHATLEDSLFEQCVFFDSDSTNGCDFSQAKLASTSFVQSDLSGCLFEGTSLSQVVIRGCKAVGAKFYKARFQRPITITKSVLRYADLRGAVLAKSDLSENDFGWANLDEADLREARLVRSDLNGVTVHQTKFAGADLRGAVLAGLDLRQVELRGAMILESQMKQLLENCEIIVLSEYQE